MQENSKELQVFNPEMLRTRIKTGRCPIIVCVGKRATGKSTLVLDLLKKIHDKNEKNVIVISGTEEMNPFYCSYIDPKYFYNSFNEEKMTEIINSRKKLSKQIHEESNGTKKLSDYPDKNV